MRDVVVTGANGWIGGRVGSLLEQRGLRVIGVSRHPEQARAKRPQWRWIGIGPELEEAVERAGVVPAEQVARMLGPAAEMVLASQRLVPRRAAAAGFVFRHPDLALAIKQILTEGAGDAR